MFPVAVMAGALWLFLFVVLLIVPARSGRTGRADMTAEPVEPPAVAHPLARVAAEGRLRELARRD